jgi:hypothetical protein
VLALLLTALLTADAPVVEVSTLDGRSVAGRLESLRSDALVLKRDSESTRIPVAELLELRTAAAPQPASAGDAMLTVTLQDGSRFRSRSLTAAGESLKVDHPDWGQLTFPVAQVRTVQIAAEEPALAAAWKQLTERTTKKDLLIIRKGDVLDHLDGVIGAIDDQSVNFLYDGESVSVKRDKVYGLIYSQKPASGAKDSVRVEFAGGDWLMSRGVTWAEDKWQIQLGGDRQFAAPPVSIQRLDYSQGKVLYLSAVEPREVNYTPYFDFVFEYQRDRHLFGGPLRLGGRTYSRGLAIHSKTVLRYRLGGEYRRFTAMLGLDPEIKHDPGKPETRREARFEVRGDGRVLFAKDVLAGDAPEPLDLAVDGIVDLELVVDFGRDNSDIGDRVHLGDAKVLK